MAKTSYKSRELGSQGLEVSRLGFGCGGLTGIYNAPLSHEDGCSIIREVFNRDITFFDTSDLYGHNHDNGVMVGKCIVIKPILISKEEQKEEPREPANTVTPPPPPPPQPASIRTPKMSTKFSDLMAFGGPAPERINGRLAMIGFVAAIGVELANGHGVFEQISNGGIPWFLGTSVLLSLASFIPLFQGVSVESKSKGVFSSDAELWNGRFAMLGLIALAFTEYVKGSTLV